ncbi:MAG TPA: hypothetical protein VGL89_00910 [Candidatus Koribacter sp.]|jgi:hypothetical protein
MRSKVFPKFLAGALVNLACGALIFSPVTSPAQTCPLKFGPAVPDTTFDQAFTQNGPGQPAPNGRVMEPSNIPGWTGGDSTYSLYLPMTGESIFFFSDSYIGQSPTAVGDGTATTNANGLRTRAVNCNTSFGCFPPTNLYRAHNSIVVRNATGTVMRTITGPVTNGFSTSYFVPSDASLGRFYWVNQSVLVTVGGVPKIYTFLMEFDGFLNYYGAAIAELSVPSLKIESIRPIANDPSGDPVHWGIATMITTAHGGPTLYIYGVEDYVPFPAFSFIRYRVPHVARVDLRLGPDGVADENNWQVFNQTSGWVSNNILASSWLIGSPTDPNNANDSIGEGFTVNRIQTTSGSAYVLVSQDTNPNNTLVVDNLPGPPNGPGPVFESTAKNIIVYTACSPEGPYSAKQVVYTTPETQANTVPGMTAGQTIYGHLWTYNPVAHPQFNWQGGGLLVSYNVNSDDSGDLVYADAYRPKFIRIPIQNLLPIF